MLVMQLQAIAHQIDCVGQCVNLLMGGQFVQMYRTVNLAQPNERLNDLNDEASDTKRAHQLNHLIGFVMVVQQTTSTTTTETSTTTTTTMAARIRAAI